MFKLHIGKLIDDPREFTFLKSSAKTRFSKSDPTTEFGSRLRHRARWRHAGAPAHGCIKESKHERTGKTVQVRSANCTEHSGAKSSAHPSGYLCIGQTWASGNCSQVI